MKTESTACALCEQAKRDCGCWIPQVMVCIMGSIATMTALAPWWQNALPSLDHVYVVLDLVLLNAGSGLAIWNLMSILIGRSHVIVRGKDGVIHQHRKGNELPIGAAGDAMVLGTPFSFRFNYPNCSALYQTVYSTSWCVRRTRNGDPDTVVVTDDDGNHMIMYVNEALYVVGKCSGFHGLIRNAEALTDGTRCIANLLKTSKGHRPSKLAEAMIDMMHVLWRYTVPATFDPRVEEELRRVYYRHFPKQQPATEAGGSGDKPVA